MGEAGLVEAKSLKLRAKGLSDYPSSEAVVKAARRGPVGLIIYIMTYLLKKGELKSSSLLHRKGNPPEKKHYG